MILTQKYINYCLKDKIDISKASDLLNRTGIINTCCPLENSIHVEYPTMRPDCNSVMGVMIELSAVSGIPFSNPFENKVTNYKESNKQIGFAVGKINDYILGEIKNEIITELLNANNLISDNDKLLVQNFCALMYGVVVNYFTKSEIKDYNSVEEIEMDISITDDSAKGYKIFLSNKEVSLFNSFEPQYCSDYFFICFFDPAKIKKQLDNQKQTKIRMYYYFIRRNIIIFALNMLNSYFEEKVLVLPEKNPIHQFVSSRDDVVDCANYLLNNNIDIDTIQKALNDFKYEIDDNNFVSPQWREDVISTQDMVNDTIRHTSYQISSFNKKVNKESSNDTYYEVYNLKEKISLFGFKEIITRPFLSKEEAKYIEVLYNDLFSSVELCNPVNKSKPFVSSSNYFNFEKQKKIHDKIFEISYIKRKYNNEITDELFVSLYGKYSVGEDLRGFLCYIWKLFMLKNLKTNIRKNGSRIIHDYVVKDKHVLLVIEKVNKKSTEFFCEFPIELLKSSYKEYKFLSIDSNILTRNYSIDIPSTVSISIFRDLINEFSDVLYILEIQNANLYYENKKIYFNYYLKIAWKNIVKNELSIWNNKLMTFIHDYTEKRI